MQQSHFNLKNKKLIYIIIIIIIISFIFCNNYSFAGDKNGYTSTGQLNDKLTLPNPLTGTTDSENINVLIGKVINAVLGIVGSLALVMFIYGGLTWMTAAGNKEKIQKGKDILIWATIGLIIIFSAYAIVHFILANVLKGGT